MKENTVFMILTALIRNFYVWLVGKIAADKAFGLEATSRVKKFVFRFVQVPFRWVFRSRRRLKGVFAEIRITTISFYDDFG